ncbi:MAG: hypothetical protein ICV60_08820 [Pyrinomonadaceae bacterium]|nr:hypothetical protein [Pyrinomonadaceae bacterium]
MEVNVLPLVPGVALPVAAPAVARAEIPPGYGVQEQCLPFTAATALGFLIKSPITFGLCLPGDVPAGVNTFMSPLDARNRNPDDERVFYVKDDPACRFFKNGFAVEPIEIAGPMGKQLLTPTQPGLSFFDREDQRDLFKIHLPYIWRTPPEVDTLFLPGINRTAQGLTILAGLVETDWYANPVNMICRKPPAGDSIHVAAGDTIAQAIFISRAQRRPSLKTLPSHARLTRDMKAELVEWYKVHAQDRSAYKKIARSQHGRVGNEKP